jgi:ribonuclease-3
MVIRKKAIENIALIEKVSLYINKLWLEFNDISNYILAFIHKSIVNEKPDFAPSHNERLEFLWDAVLELIITDKLYRDFDKKPEWELTDIRSALVRWRNLAKIAKNLNISKYLVLWKGEEISWWKNNDYLLANTLEALIWAIYIDLWIEEVKKFIYKYIYSTLNEILNENLIKDFKTNIQELAQSEYDITPNYKVLEEEWPDHNKIFKVWIYLWDKKIWQWVWSSKKKAQEEAAKIAYNKLNEKK